jgi:hypothetical protein
VDEPEPAPVDEPEPEPRDAERPAAEAAATEVAATEDPAPIEPDPVVAPDPVGDAAPAETAHAAPDTGDTELPEADTDDSELPEADTDDTEVTTAAAAAAGAEPGQDVTGEPPAPPVEVAVVPLEVAPLPESTTLPSIPRPEHPDEAPPPD